MDRAMKAVAQSLTPRSPSPSLPNRRSESDISEKVVTADFGRPLKPSRSSPSSPHIAALTPCFFHRRLKDSVDVERVLEDIMSDEFMSHSQLMQTALGVREVSKQLQRRPMKRAVRTIMIVTKARDNDLVHKTREVAQWLMSTPRYGSHVGVTVYVDQKLQKSARFDADGLLASDPRLEKHLNYWTPDMCWSHPEKFDLVLTLGGDGTVLFTSWLFQRIVPPILSFSLGSLGFLTPFDFDHFRDHLNKVMGGVSSGTGGVLSGRATPSTPGTPSVMSDVISDAGMHVNMRMRFTCTVYRAPPRSSRVSLASATVDESSKFEVLNELVIDRGPSPYVSNLELYGDNELMTVIQADGVIFSTPTGSTAYSLSAGGSLVHPDIPAILLTPICPHTLSFRPMLLNDTMALRIAVPRSSRATAYCSFDGKGRVELRQGDYVTITASKYPFPTVVGGKMEWIDSVSRTLRWNTREAQQKSWGNATLGSSKAHARTSSSSLAGGYSPGMRTAGSYASGLSSLRDASVGIEDDGPEEEEEGDAAPEAYDIEIDEDDGGMDSRDSGYDGDGGSNASNTGTVSPARKAFASMNV